MMKFQKKLKKKKINKYHRRASFCVFELTGHLVSSSLSVNVNYYLRCVCCLKWNNWKLKVFSRFVPFWNVNELGKCLVQWFKATQTIEWFKYKMKIFKPNGLLSLGWISIFIQVLIDTNRNLLAFECLNAFPLQIIICFF